MKFTFSILTVTLLAFSALAQTTFTNGTKISALVNASTPLTGAEVVPVNQSGVTKITTVAQINNAPMTALASTNAILAAAISATAASQLAASNALQMQITANVAANSSTSNTLQTLITANTTRDTATSNSISATVTANATTAAAANLATSNAILGIANAAAAQAVATGVTNGGNATFGNVNYSVLNIGNSPAPYVINLAAATFQKVSLTNAPGGNCYITITNNAVGQNVTVAVVNAAGGTKAFFFPNASQANVLNIQAGQSQNVGNGKMVLFNFTTLDSSNVIMSEVFP